MTRAIRLIAALLLFIASPAAAQDHNANPEVLALFEADQAARQAGALDRITGEADDAARQQRLRVLMAQGGLTTADDYLLASVIFQHGFGDDILLAHALATVALARGKAEAAIMVASSLDRYLMEQGHPQIYGTQFMIPFNGDPVTQAPYNPDILSDDVRRATGVPSLAEQDDQRRSYEATRSTVEDH